MIAHWSPSPPLLRHMEILSPCTRRPRNAQESCGESRQTNKQTSITEGCISIKHVSTFFLRLPVINHGPAVYHSADVERQIRTIRFSLSLNWNSFASTDLWNVFGKTAHSHLAAKLNDCQKNDFGLNWKKEAIFLWSSKRLYLLSLLYSVQCRQNSCQHRND